MECAINSVPDPFVQITMLKLLRVLAMDDENATESVADVVTSVGITDWTKMMVELKECECECE